MRAQARVLSTDSVPFFNFFLSHPRLLFPVVGYPFPLLLSSPKTPAYYPPAFVRRFSAIAKRVVYLYL